MKLIIFDIDGTLTDTVSIDDKCYSAAFKKAFNLDLGDVNMEGAKRKTTGTDVAMAKALYKTRFGKTPGDAELSNLKSMFLSALARELSSARQNLGVKGAVEIIRDLRADPNFAVAFATGSWEKSGLMKLEFAKIDSRGLPYSNCDDKDYRQEIIENAIELACETYETEKFKQIVYVGDGVWDLNAAKDLGIDFLGMDVRQTGLLSDYGAERVLPFFPKAADFAKII